MPNNHLKTKKIKLAVLDFKPVNVYDQTTVGRIYAEQNSTEWYDLVCRLDDKELSKICRYFHAEIILNCLSMQERYSDLLNDRFCFLN